MHLYLITRGVKHDVDRFVNELSAKYLPTKWFKQKKNGQPGKKTANYHMQVGVRPIQIWEIAYPEQHRDMVLNTIFGDQDKVTQHKKHNKFVYMIRKILGIEPVGEYNRKSDIMPMYKGNVEFVKVGEKKDRYQDGVEMI